jgi:hypothetical protein
MVLSESFARFFATTALTTTIAVATISGCATASDGEPSDAAKGSNVAAPHRIDSSKPSLAFLQANRERSSDTPAYSYCGTVASPGPSGSNFSTEVEYQFDIGIRDDSNWDCSTATDFFLAYFTSPPPPPARSDEPVNFNGKRCYDASFVVGFWCVSDEDAGIAVSVS